MSEALEQVFQSMRYNRKYNPKFIAIRQKLHVSTVRLALIKLWKNGMVDKVKSPADKRVSLYISKQRQLF